MTFNTEIYCDSVFAYVFGFFLLISIVCGAFVFTNQTGSREKKPVIIDEIYESLIVFFTGKYLNDKGKKWRPFYCISIFITIFIIVTRSSFCG